MASRLAPAPSAPKLDSAAEPDIVIGPEKVPTPATEKGEQATSAEPVNVSSPAPAAAKDLAAADPEPAKASAPAPPAAKDDIAAEAVLVNVVP